jgi:small subunit ribosomal protein S17
MNLADRNERKEYVGRVVSDKMDKTIVVEITSRKQHPKYKKRMNISNKLTAHDEDNSAKDGDLVRIMETRPLSKTKRFRLVDIVEESVVL